MKLKKMIAVLLGTGALALAGQLQASEVKFADPAPTAGIGYEWTVNIGNTSIDPVTKATRKYEIAEFSGSVGAKSKYEPSFTAPNFAWTHTSDWVALNVTADSFVTIEVARQQGISGYTVDSTTKAVTNTTAGDMLYPGLSIYQNWEENPATVESHDFNPMANPTWTKDLKYIDVAYADQGQSTVSYSIVLQKGKYSLNIGGVNALYCKATDPCYVGEQGYRVKITNTPLVKMYFPGG
jgi:hypothetical protein